LIYDNHRRKQFVADSLLRKPDSNPQSLLADDGAV
jgi:hypothetical protein